MDNLLETGEGKIVRTVGFLSTGASVDSSVVRIPAFQAGGPGSIPGRRT